MIPVKAGDKIPLSLMLYKTDNDKVVKANLITFYPRDEWVDEVLLVSRGNGIYDNTDYSMSADVTYVMAYYDVYENDGVTPAGYYRSEEIFVLDQINPQFANKMTTTFNPATEEQEMLVWSEKDGQVIVDSSDCEVTIKTSAGVTVWTDTDAVPNADGIFRFVHPSMAISADSNYYVIINISVDNEIKSSVQSFITIG